jgi:ribonucleoside-diphosphate reductase subunit M1
MLYKDACNRKSNQQNLGTICCSNLCAEIVQYTGDKEIAVCNVALISLNRFVIFKEGQQTEFDFEHLRQVTKAVTRNLDQLIDVNFYPVEEARAYNLRHRPIGIGVQVSGC